jgi:ABC-type transport system involved in multi-copper enzyme maturation permease subunit
VWKDLLLTRWFLLLVAPLYAVQLASLASSPPATALVMWMFTAILAFGPLAVEESQGTEALWNSLPVRRSDVVVARYLSALFGVVLGLVVAWAFARVPVAFCGLTFAWLTLVISLFLPCYFRCGIGRGIAVFALLSLGLLVVMAVVGGLILRHAGGPPEQAPELVASWIRARAAWIGAALALAMLPITAASAVLSVRFYERRDL